MSLSGTSLSRGGWAITVLAGFSVWFAGPHAPADTAAVTGSDFPRALLGLASLAQLTIGTWVLAIVGLAQLFGSTALVGAVTPHILRGALFAGAAGMLAMGPAQADRGAAPPRDHPAATHGLAGLPFPDRPSSGPPRSGPEAHRVNRLVIVQPGDTLWAIARRSLPPGPSNATIARACGAWYAANREVIGDDPDLILPHQRLHPPAKEHS